MPRYVRQRDKNSCGPIAILNALKWAGVRVSIRRGYKLIRKDTKYCPHDGTPPYFMGRVLYKNRRLTVRRPRRFSIRAIEDHLQNGGAAVLLSTEYANNHWGGHASVLLGISESGQSFRITGRYSNETVSVIRRQTLLGVVRKRRIEDTLYPQAWLISKKV
jgi:hypothetical protein